MIVHGCALGLTGEVESDYAENLGSGMIAFAALGAVGYSVCFLYSWHKDIKDFNEELGDEFIEPKKGVLGQLQSFKNNTISMLGIGEETRAERRNGGPATQENEYVVAHGESRCTLKRTPTISKKAVRKQTRKTMRWTVYMTISRRFNHGGCVRGGVLRDRIREFYAVDGW